MGIEKIIMKCSNDNIHVYNREPHFCQHTPLANMVVSSNALIAGLALRVSIKVVQQDVAVGIRLLVVTLD